jgi:type II secretory pathway component PulF
MRIKEYAGFAFIGCYAALFWVMGMMLVREGRTLAIAAESLGVLAAVCDAIGNLRILRVVDVDLSHTTQAMIDAVRYPNLVKWALLAFSLGLFGILLPRKPGVAFRIVGAVGMLTALLALLGLFSNQVLAWTGIPMLAGFLGLAILYFRPF